MRSHRLRGIIRMGYFLGWVFFGKPQAGKANANCRFFQQFEREIKVQEFVWVAYLFRQLEILVVGAIVGSLGERTCHACVC